MRAGETDIALQLIEEGAEVNASNNNGDTALMYAVGAGEAVLVARLLDQGGDPYRRNELGESALARAEQNHPELLELIREKSAFRFPLLACLWT